MLLTPSNIQDLLTLENLIFDNQKKGVYSLTLYLSEVNQDILRAAVRGLTSEAKSIALRAICALIIGKHGSSALRRTILNDIIANPELIIST
ncbi:MAG: hypothetical protein ACJAUD_001804 [Crocinitomicaceae bacterium]|jgi:hypothetical protein